jgi:hypothetical protein
MRENFTPRFVPASARLRRTTAGVRRWIDGEAIVSSYSSRTSTLPSTTSVTADCQGRILWGVIQGVRRRVRLSMGLPRSSSLLLHVLGAGLEPAKPSFWDW